MILLKLKDVKAQCRIDGTEEDALLRSYCEAAEETVAQYLGRGDTPREAVESLTEQYGRVPQAVVTAAAMLVDVWYQHRAPASPAQLHLVPYTFDLLIKPYVII